MPDKLILEKFFPYKLGIAARRVSLKLSKTYSERFNISVHEWRVMAVVGQQPQLSADDVAERTRMKKFTVSRAVAKLLDKSMLTRKFADEDKRRSELGLSDRGVDVYKQIVPLALGFEEKLLENFSKEEIDVLIKLLTRLG